MSIINILKDLRLVSESEVNKITIMLHLTEGNRQEKASSERFHVYYEGKPMYSIKKIPNNGFYELDSILITQKMYYNASKFTTPDIINTYKTEEYFYIIEEYIESKTLSSMLTNKEISTEKAENIILDILGEIEKGSVNQDRIDILEREKETIFNSLVALNIPKDIIKIIIEIFNINLEKMLFSLKYTSKDVLPKNILIKESDKPVLVDFDLSRLTHFSWIDAIRAKVYSEIEINIDVFLPKGVSKKILLLIYKLFEYDLIYQVYNEYEVNNIIYELRREAVTLINSVIGSYPNFKQDILVYKEPPKKDYDLSEFIQLFWSADEDFCEDKSIKVEYKVDNKFHRYDIVLPNEAYGAFRLDIVNIPSIVVIKNIVVINCKDEEYFINNFDLIIDDESLVFEINGNTEIITINGDPQILIKLDYIKMISIEMSVSSINTQEIFTRFKALYIRYKECQNKLIDDKYVVSKLQELENINKTLRDFENKLGLYPTKDDYFMFVKNIEEKMDSHNSLFKKVLSKLIGKS